MPRTILATVLVDTDRYRLTGNIQATDVHGSHVDQPIDVPIDLSSPTPADVANHVTQAVLDVAEFAQFPQGLHGWRMPYRSPDFGPDLMVFEFDFDGATLVN